MHLIQHSIRVVSQDCETNNPVCINYGRYLQQFTVIDEQKCWTIISVCAIKITLMPEYFSNFLVNYSDSLYLLIRGEFPKRDARRKRSFVQHCSTSLLFSE